MNAWLKSEEFGRDILIFSKFAFFKTFVFPNFRIYWLLLKIHTYFVFLKTFLFSSVLKNLKIEIRTTYVLLYDKKMKLVCKHWAINFNNMFWKLSIITNKYDKIRKHSHNLSVLPTAFDNIISVVIIHS